jgi:hypothetical protein
MSRLGINRQKMYDAARQREVLASKVNPTGEGEDLVVKEFMQQNLLQEIRAADVPMLMAMDKLQHGDITEEKQRLWGRVRDLLTAREKAAAAFKADEEGFIANAQERGNRLLKSPEERAKIRARVASEMKTMLSKTSVQRKQRIDQLKDEPKEKVIWPFRTIMRSHRGQMFPAKESVTISIGGLRVRELPGAEVMVPKSIADQIRNFYKSEQEQSLRQSALDASGGVSHQDRDVANLWQEANKLSSSEPYPVWGT